MRMLPSTNFDGHKKPGQRPGQRKTIWGRDGFGAARMRYKDNYAPNLRVDHTPHKVFQRRGFSTEKPYVQPRDFASRRRCY